MAMPDPSLVLPNGMNKTQVTLPSQNLCHYIRDDELERLGQMKHEPVMEIFLVAIGAAIGAIIPAMQEFSKIGNTQNPLDINGFITILILFGGIIASLITGYLWRQKYKNRTDLVTDIRGRNKVPVMVSNDPS